MDEGIRQEISRQLREWMWVVLVTHTLSFAGGGAIGFYFGIQYGKSQV